MKSFLPLFFLILPLSLKSEAPPQLFKSLNPNSLEQSFAFYELYPDTPEGKKALERARTLLKAPLTLAIEILPGAISLSGRSLGKEEMEVIESLASTLPNRKLKGYHIHTEDELLELAPEEIDLAKALLIHQTKEEGEIRNYLALVDLMALEILARLPENATSLEKIAAMNRFIFQEMRFRFPPRSIFAKKIDQFTFLPHVMDQHVGVCLGVSTLYISLAQRLNLPLEIVTPPGHIYVRYREGDVIVNIETTARGIHVPCEQYETIHVKEGLKKRSLKEVVGMVFINQASVNWEEGKYGLAKAAYEKALPYLEKDPFSQELLALSYIVTDEKERGKELLLSLGEAISELGEDYLKGEVDEEGIKAFFVHTDEKRESVLKKQKRLASVLEKYPRFRSGIEQMAVSFIQLHRSKEAIDWLLKYHRIDGKNPAIEYYLALLHAERKDFESAWAFLKNAETELIDKKPPQAIVKLKEELICSLPNP